LLSTSDPENIPFFSDELFRWAFWENKIGSGWDRKIKYSVKEYRELKAKVDETGLAREHLKPKKLAMCWARERPI
jgi:hypothetical protein